MRVLNVVVATAAVAIAKPIPQGVTAAISPSGSTASGCTVDHAGYFGLAVQTATGSKHKLHPVIQARHAM